MSLQPAHERRIGVGLQHGQVPSQRVRCTKTEGGELLCTAHALSAFERKKGGRDARGRQNNGGLGGRSPHGFSAAGDFFFAF
jgi:hypothetical protein